MMMPSPGLPNSRVQFILTFAKGFVHLSFFFVFIGKMEATLDVGDVSNVEGFLLNLSDYRKVVPFHNQPLQVLRAYI